MRRPAYCLFWAYAAACLGPLVALLIRQQFSVFFAERPMLVLFIPPIVIAAYLGGWWPGLLTTVFTALITAFALVPPAHRLAISNAHDLVQWSILLINGLAVSALTEAMHREKRRAGGISTLRSQLGDLAAMLPGALYVFRIEPDGRRSFPYINARFSELLGFTIDDSPEGAAQVFARMPAEDNERIQRGIAESAQSLTEWKDEFRIDTPDRGRRWFEGRSIPHRLPDGTIVWNGFAMDITERKRIEQAMRDLQQIVNRSPVIACRWRLAPGWPVEFISENVRNWGYTAEDFTSGRVPFADIMHPDDVARVGAEVEAHLNRGASEFSQEYRIRTRDGADRHVRDLTWVVRDENGQAVCTQGLLFDDTEQKAAGAELARQMDELRRWRTITLERENRVSELKQEVNALRAQLGQPPRYEASDNRAAP